MSTRDRETTILLIRGAGRGNTSLRIPDAVFKTLIVLAGLFFIALVIFVVNYGKIAGKMLFVQNVMKENRDLKHKIQKIAQIYDELDRLKEYEKKLKIMTRNAPEVKKTGGESAVKQIGADEMDDKKLDEFIEIIKLRRNMNFLSLKDDVSKRKLVLESIPNILPVDGWISRGFEEAREKTKNGHLGLDIAAAYDSRIKAAGPGIVTFSGWKDDFGNMVEIDHGYGFVTRYGHCSKSIVNKGDLVERSQTIAFVGSSGRSSAPHVHFELLKDGKQSDPLVFIYK